jgi:hypothetical protein
VDQSGDDTCPFLVGKKKVATWPTQGQPRGTPLLVVLVMWRVFFNVAVAPCGLAGG